MAMQDDLNNQDAVFKDGIYRGDGKMLGLGAKRDKDDRIVISTDGWGLKPDTIPASLDQFVDRHQLAQNVVDELNKSQGWFSTQWYGARASLDKDNNIILNPKLLSDLTDTQINNARIDILKGRNANELFASTATAKEANYLSDADEAAGKKVTFKDTGDAIGIVPRKLHELERRMGLNMSRDVINTQTGGHTSFDTTGIRLELSKESGLCEITALYNKPQAEVVKEGLYSVFPKEAIKEMDVSASDGTTFKRFGIKPEYIISDLSKVDMSPIAKAVWESNAVKYNPINLISPALTGAIVGYKLNTNPNKGVEAAAKGANEATLAEAKNINDTVQNALATVGVPGVKKVEKPKKIGSPNDVDTTKLIIGNASDPDTAIPLGVSGIVMNSTRPSPPEGSPDTKFVTRSAPVATNYNNAPPIDAAALDNAAQRYESGKYATANTGIVYASDAFDRVMANNPNRTTPPVIEGQSFEGAVLPSSVLDVSHMNNAVITVPQGAEWDLEYGKDSRGYFNHIGVLRVTDTDGNTYYTKLTGLKNDVSNVSITERGREGSATLQEINDVKVDAGENRFGVTTARKNIAQAIDTDGDHDLAAPEIVRAERTVPRATRAIEQALTERQKLSDAGYKVMSDGQNMGTDATAYSQNAAAARAGKLTAEQVQTLGKTNGTAMDLNRTEFDSNTTNYINGGEDRVFRDAGLAQNATITLGHFDHVMQATDKLAMDHTINLVDVNKDGTAKFGLALPSGPGYTGYSLNWDPHVSGKLDVAIHRADGQTQQIHLLNATPQNVDFATLTRDPNDPNHPTISKIISAEQFEKKQFSNQAEDVRAKLKGQDVTGGATVTDAKPVAVVPFKPNPQQQAGR